MTSDQAETTHSLLLCFVALWSIGRQTATNRVTMSIHVILLALNIWRKKNTDKLNRKSTFAVAVRKETTWSSFVDLTKKNERYVSCFQSTRHVYSTTRDICIGTSPIVDVTKKVIVAEGGANNVQETIFNWDYVYIYSKVNISLLVVQNRKDLR